MARWLPRGHLSFAIRTGPPRCLFTVYSCSTRPSAVLGDSGTHCTDPGKDQSWYLLHRDVQWVLVSRWYIVSHFAFLRLQLRVSDCMSYRTKDQPSTVTNFTYVRYVTLKASGLSQVSKFQRAKIDIVQTISLHCPVVSYRSAIVSLVTQQANQ
jgi:hypothetical protein